MCWGHASAGVTDHLPTSVILLPSQNPAEYIRNGTRVPKLKCATVSVLCSPPWCSPTRAAPPLTPGRGPRKASSDQQCSWYKWPRRMCSPDTYAAVGTQSSPARHMSGAHKLGTATSQHASPMQDGHLGHPRKAFPMGFPGPLCPTSH